MAITIYVSTTILTDEGILTVTPSPKAVFIVIININTPAFVFTDHQVGEQSIATITYC